MARIYDVDHLDISCDYLPGNYSFILSVSLPGFKNKDRIVTKTKGQALAFENRTPIFKINMWPPVKFKNEKLNKAGLDILLWGTHRD